MIPSAETGYAQTRRETAAPRVIEAQLFQKIAADIEAADPSSPEGARDLAEAIHLNTRFWTALVGDLSQPGNGLDDALKANLLRLGSFSIKEGMRVIGGNGDRMALVRINRMIATGLKQSQSAEAA